MAGNGMRPQMRRRYFRELALEITQRRRRKDNKNSTEVTSRAKRRKKVFKLLLLVSFG